MTFNRESRCNTVAYGIPDKKKKKRSNFGWIASGAGLNVGRASVLSWMKARQIMILS